MNRSNVPVATRRESPPSSSSELASQPEGCGLASGPVDPLAVFDQGQAIVKRMASLCTGPQFIAPISGRKYPTVSWWTSVGAALGLAPIEVSNRRLDRPGGETAYEAVVEIRHGDRVVGRGSALCSSRERRWTRADEYAIRSMASTRATGKAFRLGLSWIATLAGLESTPAEEMPADSRPGATAAPAARRRPPVVPEALIPFLEQLGDALHELDSTWADSTVDRVWATVLDRAAEQGREPDREFVEQCTATVRAKLDERAAAGGAA